MERSKQRAYDYALVIVLGIIIVTGLVILYSTSAYNGKLKFQDSFYYLKKQIFATLLGIAGMWIIARVDYHVWKKWSVPGYLVSVLLGIAVLLIGDEYNQKMVIFGSVFFSTVGICKSCGYIVFDVRDYAKCKKHGEIYNGL